MSPIKKTAAVVSMVKFGCTGPKLLSDKVALNSLRRQTLQEDSDPEALEVWKCCVEIVLTGVMCLTFHSSSQSEFLLQCSILSTLCILYTQLVWCSFSQRKIWHPAQAGIPSRLAGPFLRFSEGAETSFLNHCGTTGFAPLESCQRCEST